MANPLRSKRRNLRVAAALAIPRMLWLDHRARASSVTRERSLDGTLRWLIAAHDATPDGGVSIGYSMINGWLQSYPETTGYIMQTLLEHVRLCTDDGVLDRVRTMAHWEVEVQADCGGIPGGWRSANETPVVFNTGQVLMGWAAYLALQDDTVVRDAAARAARWTVECMAPDGHFQDGVSPASDHGRISHNTMVSYGLMEIAIALGDDELAAAAIRSAEYYAEHMVNEHAWPIMAGISAGDADYPTAHAVGYTIMGILETGRLGDRSDLVEVADRMLRALIPVIDTASGALPGRIRKNWAGGASWSCLTGTAQIACCMLRLVRHTESTSYLPVATRLIESVLATQVPEESLGAPAYGVRGCYPFNLNGYCRASFLNWAAKYHLDALHHLMVIES